MFYSNDEGNGSGLGFSSIASITNPACASCEWGRAGNFQRNTIRVNAIYQGPWRTNLSGSFYYGSGNYFGVPYSTFGSFVKDTIPGFLGTNRLNAGQTTLVVPSKYLDRWSGSTQIARGQLIPRNPFHGLPIYKVDMRLSRDFKFGEHLTVTPMVELFNLFNHPNYGSYSTAINLNNFGVPSQNGQDTYLRGRFNSLFTLRSNEGCECTFCCLRSPLLIWALA
jgi:hypothetical protein